MGFNPIAFLISFPAILVATVFHELSHGYVAYKLGDPTAKNAGRLTLNPLKHLDPLGTLMLIIFHFGWAKPVPVNPMYFKDQKKGMAYVGIAGPLANIFIAFVTMVLGEIFNLNILAYLSYGYYPNNLFIIFLIYLIKLNIYFAVFNLLPLPPLDGSKIFFSIMPSKWYYNMLRYERYIGIILVILIFTGILTPVLTFLADIIEGFLIFIVFKLPL